MPIELIQKKYTRDEDFNKALCVRVTPTYVRISRAMQEVMEARVGDRILLGLHDGKPALAVSAMDSSAGYKIYKAGRNMAIAASRILADYGIGDGEYAVKKVEERKRAWYVIIGKKILK